LDVIQELVLILGGVANTVAISILSLFFGLLIGLPLAFIRAYENDVAFLVDVYEKFFRGVPELVLMLLFFFGVGMYFPLPFKNPFFTATFVLSLRSAANQSQIFRGAIRGVGDEQMTAGRSIGFSRLNSIRYVMIPQVFTYSTPGLGSEYALLVKDSAYAYVIGVIEIMFQTYHVKAATYDLVAPYLISAALYILLTFPIATWLDTWGSKRKKKLGL
jgi:polar amino acid transport system permease protein